jgi:pilus assembly protein CpaF
MLQLLELAVTHRFNIVVAGGTGSGKTTLLNLLSKWIPQKERLITIEDAAELRLDHPNLVSLEVRQSNSEGHGQVSIRDLLRNSLRMRPDRIIVGECRGGEALDMLQAMNTGHEGSLTTIHANSPRDALSRLEVMVMMAGFELPLGAIRDQIASAVDLVIQQQRCSDGHRRVVSITEITGVESGVIQSQELFRWRPDQRHFSSTGIMPNFLEEITQRGIAVGPSIFNAVQEMD